MPDLGGNDRDVTPPSDTGSEVGGWLRKHRLKVLLSIVLAGVFVWVLNAGALPIVPKRSTLAQVKWWTLAAYLGLWSIVHLVRAVRWSLLLTPIHPVPLGRVVQVSFIGFAAIVLLPLRTGEAARPVLIRRQGQLSGWAATGTIGAERIIDGLFLSAVLLTALALATPLSPLPDRIGDLPVSASLVPGAAYTALALFVSAFVVMGTFYWRRDWARRMTHRIVGIVSDDLASWLSERVESVASGLAFLPNIRYTGPFLLATGFYWVLNAAGTWLLAWGCGIDDYTFARACVTTGVLALGILVPSAPGFFGAYQVSVYASFAMYYPAEVVTGPGAAYVFLAYLSQVVITLGAAGIALATGKTRLTEALETDVDATRPESSARN